MKPKDSHVYREIDLKNVLNLKDSNVYRINGNTEYTTPIGVEPSQT